MQRDDLDDDDDPYCVPKFGRKICTVDNAIKYSVVSSVVPFVIVTILHIIYATSYPGAYNSNSSSVLLIILNVLCIIPYLSWLIFIVLVVWFIILFTSAPSKRTCQAKSLAGGGRGTVLSDKLSVISDDRTASSGISSLLSSSQSTLDSYSRSSTFGSDSNVYMPDTSNDLSFSEMSQSISEFE